MVCSGKTRREFRLEIDPLPTNLCRVCWNENGWRYPSGSTSSDGGYAGKNGFGHEEWLFNFSWIADDGFHYGFLQPVNKVRRNEQVNRSICCSGPSPQMADV